MRESLRRMQESNPEDPAVVLARDAELGTGESGDGRFLLAVQCQSMSPLWTSISSSVKWE